jgi:hypothetical protein
MPRDIWSNSFGVRSLPYIEGECPTAWSNEKAALSNRQYVQNCGV